VPSMDVTFEHTQIFVAGRYLKLERNISNSPWLYKGQRIVQDSVEELVGNQIISHFQAASAKFASSGILFLLVYLILVRTRGRRRLNVGQRKALLL
jgi:tRNA U54 and U55 pseudouridine synthase Pus10